MYRLILKTALIASAFWSAHADNQGSPHGLRSIVDEGEAQITMSMSITVDDNTASACTDAETLVAFDDAALLSCVLKTLGPSLGLAPDVAFEEIQLNKNTRRLQCTNCCDRRCCKLVNGVRQCYCCRRNLEETTNSADRCLRRPTSPAHQLKTCWEEFCESNPDNCMCQDQDKTPGLSLTYD